MAYCRKCGTLLSEGAKFCPQCGEKAEEKNTKQCPECGFERKGSEKFCPQCGYPFETTCSVEVDNKQQYGTPSETTEFVEKNHGDDVHIKNVIIAILGFMAIMAFGAYGVPYLVEKIPDLIGNKQDKTEVKSSENDNSSGSYKKSMFNKKEEPNTSSYKKEIDVSAILYKCEGEINSIQAEIESLCNEFVILGSGDVDFYTYGRMKIQLSTGVDELVREADRVFNNCIGELKKAGDMRSAAQMEQERKEFKKAASRIKSEAQARAEAIY